MGFPYISLVAFESHENDPRVGAVSKSANVK